MSSGELGAGGRDGNDVAPEGEEEADAAMEAVLMRESWAAA